MICIDVPVEVAVVDRIEAEWARLELPSMQVVDVPRARLPVDILEGSDVCYC